MRHLKEKNFFLSYIKMNTTEVSWFNPEYGSDLNLNLVDPGGSNPSQGNISSGIHSILLMHLAKNHRYSGRGTGRGGGIPLCLF